MCRYCWETPGLQQELFREWVGRTREERDDRDYEYPDREEKWEAEPDYDELMERDTTDEMVEAGEEDREYGQVWLVAEGLRPVPNRG